MGVTITVITISLSTLPTIGAKTTEWYEKSAFAIYQLTDSKSPHHEHSDIGEPRLPVLQPFAKDTSARDMLHEEGTMDRVKIWGVYANGLKNYWEKTLGRNKIMSCRDCSKYYGCRKLIIAIEDYEDDYDDGYTSSDDLVEDIEDNLPYSCDEFEEDIKY
jgi:hypothetical protein